MLSMGDRIQSNSNPSEVTVPQELVQLSIASALDEPTARAQSKSLMVIMYVGQSQVH